MSVLLLSGGLDSAVLLAREVRSGDRPLCVGFRYGQRHARELRHARRIAGHYECPFLEIALPAGIFGSDALIASAACVLCGFLVGNLIHWLTRETWP